MKSLCWNLATIAAMLLYTPFVVCGEFPSQKENSVASINNDWIPVDLPDAGIMANTNELQLFAQWVDAAFGVESPREEKPKTFLLDSKHPPFSFRCDGRSSREFLQSWSREAALKEQPGTKRYQIGWRDPATSLRVRADVTLHNSFPSAEWVLHFVNEGTADTPIIEDIQALDLALLAKHIAHPVDLHRIAGDACNEQSFIPRLNSMKPGDTCAFAPNGGRPSCGEFPFFNVQYREAGVIVGIGWTGQWAASVTRDAAGSARVRAGMQKTHFRLHPGEQIRSPRILVMGWQGDRIAAHNRFRRLMLYHYVPKQASKPLRMPIALQTFDRYSWTCPDWATEAGQLKALQAAREAGCDTLWLDAAWFPGGFPNGVGNWMHKPESFERGLKPISDACHRAGIRFIVWFEPERVGPDVAIRREHPEFVFDIRSRDLFRLHDPNARQWLTELLSKRITEYGIDIYRNDFNTEPLNSWRDSDPPDRQGMTEIRYVEGLYKMWDDLRARHPGLAIDNCASGGRRIDLETCMRAVPLWRSDTNCKPGNADWDQAQSMGLGLYVPLSTACSWAPDPYEVRSAATSGLICQFEYMANDFPMKKAASLVEEARQNQLFWYGDMYPLTPISPSSDQWAAWQLNRPDLKAGLVLAFRRSECKSDTFTAGLHAVNPEASYRLTFIDESLKPRDEIREGDQLRQGLPLILEKTPDSIVVRYEEITEP